MPQGHRQLCSLGLFLCALPLVAISCHEQILSHATAFVQRGSMAEPTVQSQVAILQRHGMNALGWHLLVRFVEAQANGSVAFHIVQGQIKSYEIRETGKLEALGREGRAL